MNFLSSVAALKTSTIVPELIVILTLVVVLIVDLVSGKSNRSLPTLTNLGLMAAVAAIVWQWLHPQTNTLAFLGTFDSDRLSLVFRGIIALSALITTLISERYLLQSGVVLGEYLVILLTATLGGMFLAGANEMVTIFVSLETLSIASYLLSGYTKRDPRSNEAALKYLLIGASSSAIFLYGMSLLYGLSAGETNLLRIAAAIRRPELAVVLAMVLIVAGIAFKLSAVPFHQWTPDVYEGSPTPVVAFLSVGSKAAGFALAVRFLVTVFHTIEPEWHYVFVILTILSMVLGNVVAIAQTSMKRMLAYSSIGQAGFIMLAMLVDTEAGYASMIFYLLVYLFMNMGAFACVILFALRTGTDQISAYSGLYQKDPLLTLCLSICLLSLGGIPPLAGFFGKLYIFWAGWQAGAYGLVILGLVMSVVSIYYYIRVVKQMVVKEPQEMSEAVMGYPQISWAEPGMRPLQVAMVSTLIITSIAGIAANPLFGIVNDAVTGSRFLQASVATPVIVQSLP